MNNLTKLKLYLRSIPHHLECGHHSGFRYCCVFDYSVIDNFNHFFFPRIYRSKRYVNKVITRLRGKDFRYIPCPICMVARAPRETLSCADKKHRFLMPMHQLKRTVNWGSFDILSKNLKKIEAVMNVLCEAESRSP